MEVTIYLFTGFLESGKTRFIQETLGDKRFNNGEKTLLIVCEEGLEEYEPAEFSGQNVSIEYVESENDLNEKQCKALLREKKPLDKLFLAWEKHEGDHMNEIRDCIENKANDLIKLARVRADRDSR